MNGSGQRITSRIRADVFAYTQRLPMAFHDRQTVGELTSRVVSDTSTVESTLRDVGTDLIPSVLTLVGTAAVMVAVDWRLGLIGLVVAPLVFLTANHFAGLTRRYARRKRAATGDLTGLVTESLMGIRTVHAFGNQQVQDQQFATQNDTGAQPVAALGQGQRQVLPRPAAGRRRGHLAGVVRRRLRGAERLVAGRGAGGRHQLPQEHALADEDPGQAGAQLHPGRRLRPTDRRHPRPAHRPPGHRRAGCRPASTAASSCARSGWTTAPAAARSSPTST